MVYRPKFIRWVLFHLVILSVLFVSIHFLSQKLDRDFKDLRGVEEQGEVARKGMLTGAFRGFTADALFLRARKLIREKEFHEVPQLARTIVRMQPNFQEAVSYLAWDMSWNISSLFSSIETRWVWLRHGLRLWSNEAIRLAPHIAFYYDEIARTYLIKIGEIGDKGDRYYKWRLAVEIDQLIREYNVSEAASLVALRGEEWSEFWQARGESEYQKVLLVFKEQSDSLQGLGEFSKNEVALLFMADALMDEFGLSVQEMDKLEKRYGEVDWRVPSVHALYWVEKGLASTDKDVKITRQMQVLRLQSLIRIFAYGEVLSFENEETYQSGPSFHFARKAQECFEKEFKQAEDKGGLRNSFEGFLYMAVILNYKYGLKKEARHFFNLLNKEFPSKTRLALLDDFAVTALTEDAKSDDYRKVLGFVHGLLVQAKEYHGRGKKAMAKGLEALAYKAWIFYQKDAQAVLKGRKKLPNFSVLRKRACGRSL